MFKNYFKIAVRNLLRHKIYTFINVFGLALGMACCILILLFVQQEWSYDTFHKNASAIYRVIVARKAPNGDRRLVGLSPLPLAPAIRAEYPEIFRAVRLTDNEVTISYQDKVFTEMALFVDADMLEMFSFPLLQGDPATALRAPHAVVVSAEMAAKYFGSENPLGKNLTVIRRNAPQDFVVTGVAAKRPDNSSIRFDFLLPIEQFPEYERQAGNWGNSNAFTYVQLPKNVAAADLESKLPAFVKKYFAERIGEGRKSGDLSADDEAWTLQLQPLTKIHLDPAVRWSLTPTSSPVYSYILSAIALLVLLMACINFMTLAVARSASRAKEIGLRKVVGAIRAQLMQQFWGEAFLLSAFALIGGAVLAELLLPTFNRLANKNLALDYFSQWPLLVALMGLTLLAGLIAGSYPAAFLSRLRAVAVLKGEPKVKGKSRFSRFLVVLQFSLAIFLVVSTLIMSGQLDFLRTKDLGYHAEQVVVIRARDQSRSLPEILRNELSGDPKILNVSGVNNSFTRGGMNTTLHANGVSAEVAVYFVNQNFLQTLGIKLAAGEDWPEAFGAQGAASIIVNQTLVNTFGLEAALGKTLEIGNGLAPAITGVVRDFHFQSLRHEIKPMIFYPQPRLSGANILVKISPDGIPATLAVLESTWKKIAPNQPFEYYFLDDDVQSQYRAEEHWGKIVRYASGFAILISGLGLFGLAALTAIKRTKEIGIRKVLGASTARIVSLLSKEFAQLALWSNLISWPIAYWAMHRWLQDFAYRIHVGIWTFLLAGALALGVALLTVSVHAFKAALANPVEALRYE